MEHAVEEIKKKSGVIDSTAAKIFLVRSGGSPGDVSENPVTEEKRKRRVGE